MRGSSPPARSPQVGRTTWGATRGRERTGEAPLLSRGGGTAHGFGGTWRWGVTRRANVHTLVSVGVGTGESGRGSILATHPTVRWWVGTYRQKAGAVQLPGEEGAECRGCRGWSSKSLCVEHRGAGGGRRTGPREVQPDGRAEAGSSSWCGRPHCTYVQGASGPGPRAPEPRRERQGRGEERRRGHDDT